MFVELFQKARQVERQAAQLRRAQQEQAERPALAQAAVAGLLAESADLGEAVVKVLRVVGESLGWDAGALWGVSPGDGVLRCTFAAVDAEDLAGARAFLRSVVVLGGGPQTPVELHLTGRPNLLQSERLAVLASTEAAAIGVVIDDDRQQRLARHLAALVRSRCPSRVFGSHEDADAWLRSFALPG